MVVALIIIGILLFGLIIFVHEFGHFFTAKLSGIRVNEFAIGMGPQIFSFEKGETKYALRLLPIGGYCAMEGEDAESEDSGAFGNKPIWKRMLVVIMGAVMNILLGIILMSIVLMQQNLLPIPKVADFTENSKMQAAGVQVGDTILSIDGYSVYTEKDLSFAFAMANPDAVTIQLERAGEKITLENMQLQAQTLENGRTSVAVDFYVYGEPVNFVNIIKKTFLDSYSVVRMVLGSLKGLVTGQFGIHDVSGPVGATQAIAQAASAGLERDFMSAVNNIIFMMVVISINLGIFNLLPFPALDGGRFVFLLIEAIRKKPVPAKYENYVNTAGFVILIGFMVVITFKDIWSIFT